MQAYCKERGNVINAQRFVDYYAARGWKLSGEYMTDWKACVRSWEQTERPAQAGRSRAETEAEHAQGGHESGIGW